MNFIHLNNNNNFINENSSFSSYSMELNIQANEYSLLLDDDFETFRRQNDDDEEDEGPALEIYGTDITALAAEGLLEECFGREKELLEMMEILVRRQKNNPVLVGDAGVGKTAIIELFASRIVKNMVPFILEGRDRKSVV